MERKLVLPKEEWETVHEIVMNKTKLMFASISFVFARSFPTRV